MLSSCLARREFRLLFYECSSPQEVCELSFAFSGGEQRHNIFLASVSVSVYVYVYILFIRRSKTKTTKARTKVKDDIKSRRGETKVKVTCCMLYNATVRWPTGQLKRRLGVAKRL